MSWTLETTLPLVILAALGWYVPWIIQRRMPDTLRDLGWTLILSAVLLTLIGAGLFAWLYRIEGQPGDVVAQGVPRFLRLGATACLVWGPILILTAISLGQGIEKRRGEATAARDADPSDNP